MTDKPKTDEPPKGRRFRALNSLVLPQGLHAGPGATNMRLDPGQVVTLTPEAIQREQRYVNGRVRAGDLEEVEEHVVDEPIAEPATVPSPRKTPSKLGLTTGEPDKEGR